jgi:hypothetical protein
MALKWITNCEGEHALEYLLMYNTENPHKNYEVGPPKAKSYLSDSVVISYATLEELNNENYRGIYEVDE